MALSCSFLVSRRVLVVSALSHTSPAVFPIRVLTSRRFSARSLFFVPPIAIATGAIRSKLYIDVKLNALFATHQKIEKRHENISGPRRVEATR